MRTTTASWGAGSIATSVTVARPATLGGAAVGMTGGTPEPGGYSGDGVAPNGGGVGGAPPTATAPRASKTTVYEAGELDGSTRCVAPRTPSIVIVVVGTRGDPPTAQPISSTDVHR